MDRKPRNLGRAYLVEELRKRGLSYRASVRIVNFIFAEMGKVLKRGWAVEFPFGSLKRVKKLSKEWVRVGDEPMSPYTVEHELDEEGERLLNEKEGGSQSGAAG